MSHVNFIIFIINLSPIITNNIYILFFLTFNIIHLLYSRAKIKLYTLGFKNIIKFPLNLKRLSLFYYFIHTLCIYITHATYRTLVKNLKLSFGLMIATLEIEDSCSVKDFFVESFCWSNPYERGYGQKVWFW